MSTKATIKNPAAQTFADVAAMRKNAVTWREIGEKYGKTAQRSHQLYASDMDTDPAEIDRLVTEVTEYLDTYGPLTRAEVCEHFGITANKLVMLGIPKHLLIPGTPASDVRSKYTDKDFISAIRKAHKAVKSKSLSAKQYEEWRRAQDDPSSIPSVPGINLRYTWIEVCELAGVASGRPRRTGYSHRWSTDDALRYVSEYVALCLEENTPVTYVGYEEWQRTVDGAPSGSMVRRLLGKPWRNIVEESA